MSEQDEKKNGPETFDLTATQTTRLLSGGAGVPAPGMAAFEVRSSMILYDLVQVENHLPNDAVRVASTPHPERDDMMVLFYTSQSFPPPNADGAVAPIAVSWNDQNQMLVRVKEIPHAEHELETGQDDGPDRS